MAAFAITTAAVFALLGFISPQLDVLNHLQPLILVAALASFLLVPLMERRGLLRSTMFAVAGAGLLASLIVVVPEALARVETQDSAPPADGRPVLKLMTHNIFALNYDMARLKALIDREDPDIIALQEYLNGQYVGLHPLISAAYPYWVQCSGGKRANLALYSKIPFELADDGACPKSDAKVRTAHILAHFTLAEGSAFSVMTTHIDWPVPVGRQVSQFKETARVAQDVNGPVILVGDMNSTAWSYTLKSLEKNAGLVRQTHNVMTFPARFYIGRWRDTLPILPIDHVFTRGIDVHELHATEPSGSDHLPVVITFSPTNPVQF